MDTSETYIKMCERPEIQALRVEYEVGDYYWWTSTNGGSGYMIASMVDFGVEERMRGDIWLPRQDQLQEMIELRGHKIPQDLIGLFASWVYVHNYKWNLFYGSMEQLWLAFVMKENYNKIWLDGKWIDG